MKVPLMRQRCWLLLATSLARLPEMTPQQQELNPGYRRRSSYRL
jgi:hypothetical protein